MKDRLPKIVLTLLFLCTFLMAQTNEWATEYVVFDDSDNGTGWQTASVAATGPNRFVGLVITTPESPILDNLFAVTDNYLVGYWDADSGMGRVLSPINGDQVAPLYAEGPQQTVWEYVLDQIPFTGAWQIASGDTGLVYVANNDAAHNILVFQLTADGLISSPYRMETGSENIFGIEVDTAGYVYVVDYEGNGTKTNEVRVYAGIGAPLTTWADFGGHNDDPVTTIDLPEGFYQGITVSSDGSALYISATSERAVWKYSGDPESGYTPDEDFIFALAEDDTIANGGSGTPSVLGLAYLDDPGIVFAAADSFLHIGASGGYPYANIYALDATWGSVLDTIDIAQWNLDNSGSYATGSSNGRVGGYASLLDVDVEPEENAVYTQTYYGWALEKWVFDGELGGLVDGIAKVKNLVPENFDLRQNYPNPFNPATTIEFDLEKQEFVTLTIYNALGQLVETLVQGTLTAGTYSINFDGSQLTSGVYFYQLSAGKYKDVKKMVLTK